MTVINSKEEGFIIGCPISLIELTIWEYIRINSGVESYDIFLAVDKESMKVYAQTTTVCPFTFVYGDLLTTQTTMLANLLSNALGIFLYPLDIIFESSKYEVRIKLYSKDKAVADEYKRKLTEYEKLLKKYLDLNTKNINKRIELMLSQ